jgi:ZIP family zinc transporter
MGEFLPVLLSAIVVEEIVPQAHRQKDARLATVFLVAGFALFALLTAYLE